MRKKKFTALAIGAAVALACGATPAMASQTVDKGEYVEVEGYSISYDFSDNSGVEITLLSPEGEVIADLSEYANDDIVVDTDGSVTVERKGVANLPIEGSSPPSSQRSVDTQAAACGAYTTIKGKYGNIKNRGCRSGSEVKSNGSYTDTKADGWCLGVRAKWPSGSTWSSGYANRACPKGNTKSFDTGYKTGSRISFTELGWKAKN